ncbi:MAG TPA: O-antigen ligase family protein, partial [Anaerolineae bacterium]|nr:O-antigen ligase family protein [Anaerolineae bacterium]
MLVTSHEEDATRQAPKESERTSNPQAMQNVSAILSERATQGTVRPASATERLVDRALWLYPFIAPPLLFPTFAPLWTGLAALAIVLLFILRRRAAGHFIPRTPLDWPILGLLFVVPIGVWASSDISLSLPRITVLLLGAGLFYATVDAVRSRPDRLHLLTWGLALIGGGVALIGLVGTDWFAYKLPALGPIYDNLPRLIRDIPNSIRGGIHPNELAGTLVFLLPVAIAVLVTDVPMRGGRWAPSARWTRLLAGAIVALMGGVLILSQSRWGLAVLAVAMLVWLAVRSRRPWRLLLIGALLIGAATVVIGPERLVDAIFSANLESAWHSRIEVWRNALNTIQDFPFTGIGLGTFARVSPLLYPYVLWQPGVNFGHAHNLFLQIGVDLGVIGLVSALAAAIILAGVARRGYRQSSGVRREVL